MMRGGLNRARCSAATSRKSFAAALSAPGTGCGGCGCGCVGWTGSGFGSIGGSGGPSGPGSPGWIGWAASWNFPVMGCTGSVGNGSTIGPVPPVIGTGAPIGTKAKNGRWRLVGRPPRRWPRSQLDVEPEALRDPLEGHRSGVGGTRHDAADDLESAGAARSTVVVSVTGVGDTRRSRRFRPRAGGRPVGARWRRPSVRGRCRPAGSASAGEVRIIRACAGASTCSPTAGSIGLTCRVCRLVATRPPNWLWRSSWLTRRSSAAWSQAEAISSSCCSCTTRVPRRAIGAVHRREVELLEPARGLRRVDGVETRLRSAVQRRREQRVVLGRHLGGRVQDRRERVLPRRLERGRAPALRRRRRPAAARRASAASCPGGTSEARPLSPTSISISPMPSGKRPRAQQQRERLEVAAGAGREGPGVVDGQLDRRRRLGPRGLELRLVLGGDVGPSPALRPSSKVGTTQAR